MVDKNKVVYFVAGDCSSNLSPCGSRHKIIVLLILWTVTARGMCIGEQDVLREQKMLEDMSRRVKEGDDDERRRLEEEVARHKVSACSS